MPTKEWMINNPQKALNWKKSLSKGRKRYIKINPNFQSGEKNPMYSKKPWNYGLTKEQDNRVRKYAETRSKKLKNGEIIKVWLGKKHSLQHRIKNSLAKRGDKNPMKNKEVRLKVSKTIKDKWKYDKEYIEKTLKAINYPKNRLEKSFEDVCKKYDLPFIFTGDGSFWIGPCISGKRRNPDFKHINKKIVILLNGDHWHTKEEIDEQVTDYESMGYKVIPIWESEWYNNSKENIIKSIKKYIIN